MSINMADVKQIMYGNKEVTKIEDGLGNVLWQKEVEVDPYLIYIGERQTYYKLDMINKVATKLEFSSGAWGGATGNRVFAWKPDADSLTIWGDTYIKDIAIDLDNNKLTFTDHESGWSTNNNYDGNYVYSIPATTGYGLQARIARSDASGFNYSYYILFKNYMNGGQLYVDGQHISDNIKLSGNTAIKIGNDMYICKTQEAAAGYPYLYKFVSSASGLADYYETSTIPVNPLGQFNTTQNPWAFWTANGRLFWDQDGYHYEYNFTTGQWQSHSWKGFTESFKGSRVFKWNNRVFMLGKYGTDRTIYELNLSTDTWSKYWTNLPVAMRGDCLIDRKGRIGAGQNCAPRLA